MVTRHKDSSVDSSVRIRGGAWGLGLSTTLRRASGELQEDGPGTLRLLSGVNLPSL